MKIDANKLLDRMRQKAITSPCCFKVSAAAIDNRGRIIDITRNAHRNPANLGDNRSWHAEEIVIHRNPPIIRRILIARFNKNGKQLPIVPCSHCEEIAGKRGIEIVSI
jgi:cytidine deaminase